MRSSRVGEARDRRALPAAFNYLIIGTIGATFYVIGIGFLYAATGTLNMADMAVRLATLGDNAAVQAGLCVHRGGAWHQGGDVPAAWLAAGRVCGRAEPCVGVPRGDGDQGSDLSDRALRVRRVSGWRSVRRRCSCTGSSRRSAAAAVIVCSVQAIFAKEVQADPCLLLGGAGGVHPARRVAGDGGRAFRLACSI